MAAEKKIKDNEEKATPTKKEKTVSKEESTEDAKKKKTSETKSKTKTKSAAVKSKATTVSKNRDETDSEKPKSRAASSAKKTSPAKKGGKGSTAAKKSVNSKAALKNFAAYNGKTLVVVESPSKAKTLEKILGPKYKVLASIGHVCDLPKARLAIDIDNGFEPEYIQVRGKADLIKTLKGASAASKTTLLASDPDREGEAIAWHLASLLGIDPEEECRIRMHEITSNGVKSAVAAPDKINMGLVDAQQARRVLDRLVGYELSPLLWYKVKRGLSAGRVQSVALRIVCEREEEIENFVPEEYWNIDVDAKSLDGKRMYRLRAEKFKNKKIEIKNAEEALEAEKAILANPLIVDEFGTKDDKKHPNPPFKTSTLQQEASRRCGFAPKRTMRIAQSLYEGVEIPGRGPTGLITYMRTDSLRLSPEALGSSRSFIEKTFGKSYLPAKANEYTPKGRAQDAHEAIRATDAALTPESIKDCLTPEQFKLYDLIWRRFIASQMADAVVSRTNLVCSSGDYKMKQSGSVVSFDGWGKLYPLGIKDITMSPAVKGEELSVEKIIKEQKFTQPPARYTDAGLVKVLEEKGIGRPSTYASIIDTLSIRGYVDHGEEDKKIIPTKLGRIVNKFLVKNFSEVINEDFTANMENELDEIESGTIYWRDVLKNFWPGFKAGIEDTKAHAESMKIEPEPIGEKCPECGRDLVKRTGRFGDFIACIGYPECKYTRNILKTTGVKCPKCGQGEIVRRKAGKGKAAGRTFYGCSRYPDCDFITNKKPVSDEKKKEQEFIEPNESDM